MQEIKQNGKQRKNTVRRMWEFKVITEKELDI